MKKNPRVQPLVCLLIGISILLGAWGVGAQVITGTISGVVTDPSGAVMPGVSVTAQNVQTGLVRQTQTNEDGIYTFPALPVGQYTVRAERQGFTTVVKRDLKLDVDRTLRLDIVLEVGAVEETVEVVAGSTQLLQADTSDIGQVVNSPTIENLPLNGREFWQLALLTSGVSPGPSGIVGPVFGFRSITANGQRVDANLYVIDGFDDRELDSNQDQTTPNLDSVAEFSVHTNTYSAALGSGAGAVISVQTKSGTNEFHGTLFEFFRNDTLDATNFFANKLGLEKDPLRFNQFGGSIGGPIVRDKAFFFADYQGDRVRRGFVQTATVPTIARRNGDFSDLLSGPNPVQLINPLTFMPIPGNIIDPTIMDPPAAALAALFPEPNLPGTQLNYATLLVNGTRRDAVSGRGDLYFGKGDSLSVRYYYLNLFRTSPVAFGPVLGGPPVLGGTDAVKRHSITVAELHPFSPTLMNEFRFGWNKGPRNLLNNDYYSDLGAEFGIPGIAINEFTNGLPWLLFAGGGSDFIGPSIALPQFLHTTNYEFSDVLSFLHGKHKIQVGGRFVHRGFDVWQTIFPRGFYIYLGFSSLFSTGAIVPGADFADFLLGVPYQLQRDYLDQEAQLRTYQVEAFFQDDIKVTPRLTLNLGVRYDLFPPLLEKNNLLTNFDPATATLVQAPDGGFGRRLKKTDKNNIAPRIGFSYALTEDAKTLVRGGFGLFYFDMQNVPATQPQLIYNPPNFFAQTGPSYPLLPPLSVGLTRLPTPPLDQPQGSVRYHPTDFPTAYSEQWNLNIQRELPLDTFLEVAYVGTRGLHLVQYLNLNQPYLDDMGNRARPYGDQITGLRTWAPSANSVYHGLQVKAERRLSQGLQYLVAYTFSKSIDTQSTGVWGGNDGQFPQDNYNLAGDRGPSLFDVRHRFVGSFVWELPFFRNAANPVAKNVLGGWQVNGIVTLQSGVHFTPILTGALAGTINPMWNDPTVTDLGDMRPNVIGNPNLPSGDRTIDQWYDVSAFDITFAGQPHDEGTFGNAGRGILEGPGIATTDLSLFKEIPITEQVKLQFRAEFFNLFNRVNLNLPVRTVDLNGGQILSAKAGREIQLGLKLLF